MTPNRLRRIREVLNKRQPDLTVVTDEVHKGRNIAAIMRTCDAVGIDTVHVVHPKEGYRSYRGTALGTQKWVGVETYDSLAQPVNALKNKGFQLVVTSVDEGSVDYTEVDYTLPTALILGSESEGVSAEALNLATAKVTVPMVGMVESLNVSVACAIILQEAQRQRNLAGMYNKKRLGEAHYRHRFFQWAHPSVAEFCEQKGVPYPEVDESGEIIEPSTWYANFRKFNAQ